MTRVMIKGRKVEIPQSIAKERLNSTWAHMGPSFHIELKKLAIIMGWGVSWITWGWRSPIQGRQLPSLHSSQARNGGKVWSNKRDLLPRTNSQGMGGQTVKDQLCCLLRSKHLHFLCSFHVLQVRWLYRLHFIGFAYWLIIISRILLKMIGCILFWRRGIDIDSTSLVTSVVRWSKVTKCREGLHGSKGRSGLVPADTTREMIRFLWGSM